MNRRKFVLTTSASAMAVSLASGATFLPASKKMGIVVHSYARRWNSKIDSKVYPAFTDALQLIDHCKSIDAGGVQVGVGDWTEDFSKKVFKAISKNDMYLEGSITLPQEEGDVMRFEREVKNARIAGATVLRSVCLFGRRYETFESLEEFEQFRVDSIQKIKWAEPVVRRNQMKLAIENHKDWRAEELVAIMKEIDSEWVGVTLDFGNNVSLLEDSVSLAQAVGPYLMSTHVKDMSVEGYDDGFLLSGVPLGKGDVDLKSVVNICLKHNPNINFSLEMITRDPLEIPIYKDKYWATMPNLPGIDVAMTMKMVREKGKNLPRYSELDGEVFLGAEESNVVASLKHSKNQLLN